jgi:hypothetical protein
MTAHSNDTDPPTGRRRMNRSRVIIASAAAGSLVVGAGLAAFLVVGPTGASTTSANGIRTGSQTTSNSSVPTGPARSAGLAAFLVAGPVGASTSSASGIPAGFPTASDSGIPPGTVLKSVPGQVSSGPGWAWNKADGYLQVTGNGANLTGLRIPGTVNVSANNVTLNDISITVGGDSSTTGDSYGVTLDNTANVTIENSNIQGTNTTTGRMGEGIKDVYTDSTGTQVLKNNIQKTDTAIQLYQGLIKGNYIHNLGLIDGDHVNGITTNGDIGTFDIENNTILNKFNQTDAIGLFQDFGVVANVTINNNYLAGGGYTIYGGDGSIGQSYNIKVTNNRISTMYFPNGGQWGPVAYFDDQGPGNTWSGNTWAGSGTTIPEP